MPDISTYANEMDHDFTYVRSKRKKKMHASSPSASELFEIALAEMGEDVWMKECMGMYSACYPHNFLNHISN